MNIAVCMTCKYRQPVCAGPCVCTVDGRDIGEHAREGNCYYDFFRTRAVESHLLRSGVPPQHPKHEPGGCGCAE